MSVFEGLVMNALIGAQAPSRIFEFGTFDGRTSLIMAESAPAAELFTLDLPAADLDSAGLTIGAGDVRYIEKQTIGQRILESPARDRIRMLQGDSATFDYAELVGTMDFVFVDACHEYDYVVSDSRIAKRLLRPEGGTIIWHDYAVWTGVTRCLNEFQATGEFGDVRRIEGTTMGIARF